MIYNVDIHKTEDVPLVVINLSTDSVYLSKGEIMGFMQSQSLDISEITTETSTEPSPIWLEEGNDIEGLEVQKKKITLKYTEKNYSIGTLIFSVTEQFFSQSTSFRQSH